MNRLRVSIVCCVATALGVLAAIHFHAKRVMPLVSLNDVERTTRLNEARPGAAPYRMSLDDHERISSGLFGTPIVVPPKPVAPPAKQAAAPHFEPPDPLADFIFTGTVTIDGKEYALLENRKTKEGEYVAVGDDFHGSRIVGIEKDGVSFTSGGGPRRLALNDNFSLTPLAVNGDGTESVRQEVARGSAAGLALSAMTAERFAIADWIGQDVDHLKDQVFEGHMSVDEYNQKVGSQPSATLFLSVRLNAAIDTFTSENLVITQ